MTGLSLTQARAPVMKPAMRIAGVGQNFNATTIAGLPKLWERLAAVLPLAGQVDGATYGVSRSGLDGKDMHYLAGVEVAAGLKIPADYQDVELSERSYLVFRQTLDGGPLHPQMQAAAKEIWGRRIPAGGHNLAHAPELEVYPPGFRPSHDGAWVEWWIPVEG